MHENLIAKVSVSINASVSKVWDALINPEMIKQYLFGTEAVSDWKEGSEIIYKGEWQGKEYEDKGKILKMVPEELFESTYWSSMSGTEDTPENYSKVTYELISQGDKTIVNLSQDNNKDEESKTHSEKNWEMVLAGMKKLLENPSD